MKEVRKKVLSQLMRMFHEAAAKEEFPEIRPPKKPTATKLATLDSVVADIVRKET